MQNLYYLQHCRLFTISVANSTQTCLLYLHEVTKALLTEDIFEEDQVLFMVCIRMELRGEQGQSLMQPYTSSKTGAMC